MGEFGRGGDELGWAGNGNRDGHGKRERGIVGVKKRLSGQAKSAGEGGICVDCDVGDGGGSRDGAQGGFGWATRKR